MSKKLSPLLTKSRKNLNKIKPHYVTPLGTFRAIKTANEVRKNSIDMAEYGEGIVRGKRRNVPDAFDDIINGVWEIRQSWKHNSKRGRQHATKA